KQRTRRRINSASASYGAANRTIEPASLEVFDVPLDARDQLLDGAWLEQERLAFVLTRAGVLIKLYDEKLASANHHHEHTVVQFSPERMLLNNIRHTRCDTLAIGVWPPSLPMSMSSSSSSSVVPDESVTPRPHSADGIPPRLLGRPTHSIGSHSFNLYQQHSAVRQQSNRVVHSKLADLRQAATHQSSQQNVASLKVRAASLCPRARLLWLAIEGGYIRGGGAGGGVSTALNWQTPPATTLSGSAGSSLASSVSSLQLTSAPKHLGSSSQNTPPSSVSTSSSSGATVSGSSSSSYSTTTTCCNAPAVGVVTGATDDNKYIAIVDVDTLDVYATFVCGLGALGACASVRRLRSFVGGAIAELTADSNNSNIHDTRIVRLAPDGRYEHLLSLSRDLVDFTCSLTSSCYTPSLYTDNHGTNHQSFVVRTQQNDDTIHENQTTTNYRQRGQEDQQFVVMEQIPSVSAYLARRDLNESLQQRRRYSLDSAPMTIHNSNDNNNIQQQQSKQPGIFGTSMPQRPFAHRTLAFKSYLWAWPSSLWTWARPSSAQGSRLDGASGTIEAIDCTNRQHCNDNQCSDNEHLVLALAFDNGKIAILEFFDRKQSNAQYSDNQRSNDSVDTTTAHTSKQLTTTNRSYHEGARVTLVCTPESGDIDSIKYEWFKHDANDKPSEFPISTDRGLGHSALNFKSVEAKDSGKYTCVASNRFGSHNVSTVLNVNVPLKWKIKPKNRFDRVGASLSIDCQAAGQPEPTVRWTRLRSRSNITIAGPVLHFPSLTQNDAGIYECVASNGVDKNLREVIELDVKGK
ncbi:Contactin-1a, partial [Fragariocoptes setiger]